MTKQYTHEGQFCNFTRLNFSDEQGIGLLYFVGPHISTDLDVLCLSALSCTYVLYLKCRARGNMSLLSGGGGLVFDIPYF